MKPISLIFLTYWIMGSIVLYGQTASGVTTDILVFNEPPQRIALIRIPVHQNTLTPDLVVSTGHPVTISDFGKAANAVAAINGSFFDTKTFEMVTYYEENDQVYSHNANTSVTSLFTGIIIIDKTGELLIEPFKGEDHYQRSAAEAKALASGPMLLNGGEKYPLPVRPGFTLKRHPRSCLCITGEEVLLIAVDGRSPKAAGMTLPELQELALTLGCEDAINLDGGGSTSLWLQGKGVLNHPSDAEGERKVVNALVWIPLQQ